MRITDFAFGTVTVDGVTYEHDVVIEGDTVRKRSKKPSKRFQAAYGHTPLTAHEAIPWDCSRLIIGTGAHGALPVADDVRAEAKRRGVELMTAPTREAITLLRRADGGTNAILHVTC